MVPDDLSRISDHPRLRIYEPVAIPPMIVPESLKINTYGPRDPCSAVAVHINRRAGERVAVTIVGGSHIKYHEGKSTHRSLVLPPSSQRLVPAASVQSRISSRRMSGYSCGGPGHAACPGSKARDIALATPIRSAIA